MHGALERLPGGSELLGLVLEPIKKFSQVPYVYRAQLIPCVLD